MGAARYVGRVGRLAIALGIGSAIATGHGVAWADQSDGGASSGHTTGSSTSSAADSAGSPNSSPKSSAGDTPQTTGHGHSDRPKTAGSGTGTGSGTEKPSTPTASLPGTTDVPKTPKRPRQAAETTPKPVAEVSKPVPQSPKPVTTAATNPVTLKLPTAAVSTAPATATLPVASPVTAAATGLVSPSVAAPTTTGPLNPVEAVVKAVSSVLNWAFNPNGSPTAPTLAWTVLAFARREFDNLMTAFQPQTPAAVLTTTTQLLASAPTALTAVTAATAATITAATNPPPAFPTPGQQLSPSTSFVNWVTGNFDPNNTLSRFGVWGTDVGTMWDNGIADNPSTPIDEHQVLMAFGDTFSGPNMTGTWLSNVLFRTSTTNLANGISIPDGQWFNGNMFGGAPLSSPTTARQIILPSGLPAGLPTGVTLIPTAGISVPTPGTQFGATQYLSFMSVQQWGSPGQWTTNYSGMAYSTDNGENWTVAPQSIRQNWGGNSNFQQAALVRPGDGYVYEYGTPNGRGGAAYVSRVAQADILDTSKYQYYNKGNPGWFFGWGATQAGWYNDPSMATPVFGQDTGACGIAQAGNNVGELSVQYNKTLGKYVTLYADQFNNVVLRTADSPQGTWSSASVLMPQQNGGIYAPMMDPWSPSTLGTGTDLYWNLSLWSDYNVMLMKTDLTKV
ncbi:MAG: DUF4185 domain-containing protein [Mycobacterium sp.]|nr:DUF4185 domain-containing protein [Mycobacterium sp.]